MPTMEKLPADLEAQLPAIRDEWIDIGLGKTPANRADAETGVRWAYAAAGLQAPRFFIWLGSPLQGAYGAAMLKAGMAAQVRDQVRDQVRAQVRAQVGDPVWAQVRNQVGAQVRDQVRAQVWAQVGDPVWAQVRNQVWDQVWDQVGDQVWDQVRNQVGAQVRAQVRNQVGDQVWDQVGDPVWAQVGDPVWAQVRAQVGDPVWAQVRNQVGAQVRAQVGDQVWAQVRNQVWDQVWDQVGDPVWDQVRDQVGAQVWDQVGDQVWDQVQWGRAIYGNHEVSWLSWYDIFKRAGIQACSRLDGIAAVAKNAGWWWPFEGAVIMTDRHDPVQRDAEGRLHCEHGPAVHYPDGFSLYCWHGVRVHSRVIEHPETLTGIEILQETNAEIRRVMVERIGYERFLELTQAKRVQADDYGELYRIDIPNDEPVVLVRVDNSTPEPDGSIKKYTLRVPPTIETARGACAWTFDLPESEYEPAMET